MIRRLIVLLAGAALVLASGSAANPEPTVAQIKAAIAKHSNDFVLANAFAHDGSAPGHGWLDLKTSAARWLSPDGKVVTLQTVAPDPRDSALLDVTATRINYATRTWYRTTREEPAKLARLKVGDPLATSGVQYKLLGVERVDGRQTYHLRSTSSPYSENETARSDVWFSTDQDYLIRATRTTRGGQVVQRVDNHWLPRTPANLALVTAVIPSGFRQVFVSS